MFVYLIPMFVASLLPLYLLIAFISNTGSFPKPLTPEEEQKYLQLHEKGDTEAKNILVEHNLRLVAHIAKKYVSTGQQIDDLISIGTIGLIKGIGSYNSGRGTKLATYVARCIENEILMVIRANKKNGNSISLEEPIGRDKDGNNITLNDILSNEHDEVLEEASLKIQVRKLYDAMKSVLKPRESMVLEMRYGLVTGEELTQKEVAKILGISRSYVSRIEKKAVSKLGLELNAEQNSCN